MKKSSSSRSVLFSTEEDEEGGDSEIEIDDYFSLSSDSSLSSCPEIGYSNQGLGFSSLRRDDVRISEMVPCSSSEASTSSSIYSNSPLKNPYPHLQITLAEKLGCGSTTFRKETGDTEDLFSNSTVCCRKTGKKKHIHSNSSVSDTKTEKISQKTGQICTKDSVSGRKMGEICSYSSASSRETGEISRETEYFRTESSVFHPKTEPLSSETPDLPRKSTKIHRSFETRACPMYLGGKIEESYAVEKESRDPYGDFKESMVEMIVEKKISGAKDLEKLLLCFLSLNSSAYHRVILQVFSEISEGLIRR